MKKIHVVGLALFAVFALSALTAVSASAAPQLLLAGAEIKTAIPLEVTGSLLLEDMNAVGKPDVLCTGIFDGTAEVGGTSGLIEALLTEGKELLNENGELNGAGNDMIDCVSDNGTCSGNVLLTVLNMPWHIEIALDETKNAYLAKFLTEAGKEPTYDVMCESILGLVEDECKGESSARLYVDTLGNLRGAFNSLALTEADIWAAESQPANCSMGGAGQGLIQSVTLGSEPTEDIETFGGLVTSSAGALTVSE